MSKRRLAQVEEAVAILLAKELIVETRKQGMPPYYRLDQDKREEIFKIVGSGEAIVRLSRPQSKTALTSTRSFPRLWGYAGRPLNFPFP
jgi:hypothetical protein